MNKILAGAFALGVCCSAVAADRFDIAITVDDLPAHGRIPPGMTRLGIAQTYLATLKAHGVPEAFGFVNAKRIADEPGSEAVLDAWRAAGYPLGNHTYSHLNVTKSDSLDAWKSDVTAGEPEVATRMQGADWHYLRFPNLSAGSGERADGVAAFLKSRGYKIADVTVAFGDWVYTDAYARCVAKGDKQAIATMKVQYLHEVDQGIARMKLTSQAVYGRVIPQVLLTHLGGWSAATLPDVMARLDAAGARYVTLAQAQSDAAYGVPGGGGLMPRTAKRNGVTIPSVPHLESEPLVNVRNLCR